MSSSLASDASLQKNQGRSAQERGVAILEFALISGVVFMLLLALFEVGRYYTAQALLTRGAQEALKMAKIAPEFRLDIQNIQQECTTLEPGQTLKQCIEARYNQFAAARNSIANEAAQLALSTIVSDPDSQGSLRLLPFTINDAELNINTGGAALNLTHTGLNALVLRPGDRGYTEALNGGTIEVAHPQVCSPAVANCPFPGIKRQPQESLVTMYQNYPIVVRVSARYQSLVPWIPDFVINGVASGFREVGAQIQTGRFTEEATCLKTPADCDGNFFLDPSCQCACGLTDAECPGNQVVEPDDCVCACTSNSETKANCFGAAIFDFNTCACACQAGLNCSEESVEANPANGCACNCDVANFPCPPDYKAQPKPGSTTGQCECACDLNALNCPGFLSKDSESCSCVCNADSEAAAGCYGRAEFDQSLCACSCPADISCITGLPDPAKGCSCACDPSTIECKENEYVQTKDEDTGECECVCGITEDDCAAGEVFNEEECRCMCDPPKPMSCPNGQKIVGCLCECEITEAECPGNLVLDEETCECACNEESEASANCGSKNAIFNSETCSCECPNSGLVCANNQPPSLANNCNCQCDPASIQCPPFHSVQPKAGDPLGGCECVCSLTQAQCGPWKKPDMDSCSCVCNHELNQSTCASQGRAYDSDACSCGACLFSVADCAINEDFNSSTCTCQCNQTPCPANKVRANFCKAPCECIAGAKESCLANPTNTWTESNCECKPLGSIGF